MSKIESAVNGFFLKIWITIRDFLITCLVHLYVFCKQWFPYVALISLTVGSLLLITVYGAKKIRQQALFTFILIIPFSCACIYYTLAIFLSYYSVTH